MICPKCRLENPEGTRFCGQCGAPLSPTTGPSTAKSQTMSLPLRELVAGTTLAGRYEVIEELGKGGMGRVYKVLDREIREKLALKLLNPDVATDEPTIERFRNELKLARTISHRHVCRMYDLGREEGAYYITMEYVAGEDLKSLIHRIGALPVGKSVSVARQVAEGLAEAHRLGIVHRDLKPHNIMIDRDGQAKVMDFGIARSVKAKGITGAGVIVGTPEYMSPEQVDGKDPDRRSDIYALGVVLFEMLTGRLPFEGDTPLSVAVKQKSEPPPDPKKINALIPDDLRRVVLKCLEKSKERRYQSAEDLVADLAGVEKSLPQTTAPLPVRKPLTSKQITVQFTLKKLRIPALVLLVLTAAFIVWQLIPRQPAARPSLAVFGFKNQTGDKSYDYLQEAIPNLLITSLEQSGRFRVTSWERLNDLLRQSGQPQTAALNEETGFDLCRRDNIEVVVIGSFVKAGDMFATDVKVLDTSSKKLLKSAGARGQGVDSILKTQIDDLSRAVSRSIKRLPLKVDKPQPKVMDLTTTSLEAYNYFLRGREEGENLNLVEAKKLLEKAVSLDPTFAVAYLYLARAENRLNDQRAQEESLQKAKEYANKATEKERLYIEAQYAAGMENDPEKQQRLLKELTEKYPQEKFALFELGNYYRVRNRFAEAIQEFEQALALDPSFGPALNLLGYAYAASGEFEKAEAAFVRYISTNPGDANPIDSLAELYLRMGQLDKAEAKYKEALALQSDFIGSCAGLTYIFALRENYNEMERWQNEFISRATPTQKMEGLWIIYYCDYLQGRLEKSLAGYLSLRKIAESYASAYMMATVDWILGFLYCDLGRFAEAGNAFQSFHQWLKQAASAESFSILQSLYLGWLDFKQGRLEAARARLTEIQPALDNIPDADEESRARFLYQFLDAEVALAGESPEKAVAVAERLQLRDFPGMSTDAIASYNIPFCRDVLPRALWKKGDLNRAVVEYKRLMTITPQNKLRYLIHPLFHYRLGRVLEEKGDKAEAAQEYRKFLEYWKDADSRQPELADARQRLAALKQN
jgi:serine/threonine protein kinase/Flp pilus assembly protein TadD